MLPQIDMEPIKQAVNKAIKDNEELSRKSGEILEGIHEAEKALEDLRNNFAEGLIQHLKDNNLIN